MKDPATKYLKVVSGQEVSLSPKGIVVQCSGGAVRIEVLKSGKINLYAQDEMQIAVRDQRRCKADGKGFGRKEYQTGIGQRRKPDIG